MTRKPSPRPAIPPSNLPPEIVAVLRRNAEETIARHTPLPDGRCSYCSATWLHTDSMHPCPPYRIAAQFRAVTDPGA
jgi:hypothetical protein